MKRNTIEAVAMPVVGWRSIIVRNLSHKVEVICARDSLVVGFLRKG